MKSAKTVIMLKYFSLQFRVVGGMVTAMMPTSMGGHWEDSPEVLPTVFAGTHGNDLIKFSTLVS